MPKIIDLSHSIDPAMPVYPGSVPPVISQVATLEQDGYLEHLISFYTHTGTHIDTPAHLIPGGHTIDAFTCEKFYGIAAVVDCQNVKQINRDMVQRTYEENDRPDFLLFYSHWIDFWGTEAYFRDFPVLTKDAAGFISSLPLKGVGIDAISFDPIDDEKLPNHMALLSREIILIENLRELRQLLNKQFHFSCQPLKIKGADGCPVRAFAVV